MSTVRDGRSHLFPTNTMGTSSESFTRLICSLDIDRHKRNSFYLNPRVRVKSVHMFRVGMGDMGEENMEIGVYFNMQA